MNSIGKCVTYMHVEEFAITFDHQVDAMSKIVNRVELLFRNLHFDVLE